MWLSEEVPDGKAKGEGVQQWTKKKVFRKKIRGVWGTGVKHSIVGQPLRTQNPRSHTKSWEGGSGGFGTLRDRGGGIGRGFLARKGKQDGEKVARIGTKAGKVQARKRASPSATRNITWKGTYKRGLVQNYQMG